MEEVNHHEISEEQEKGAGHQIKLRSLRYFGAEVYIAGAEDQEAEEQVEK